MKAMLLALRVTFRYKTTMLASVLCSLMVAVFWGCNIGIVYPATELVFQGQTISQWAEKEITLQKSETKELSHTSTKAELLEKVYPFINEYTPKTPFGTLLLLVSFLFIGTLLKSLFLIGNILAEARLGVCTTLDIQKQLFHKSLELVFEKNNQISSADTTSRIVSDVHAIGNAVVTIFGKLMREPMKFIACVVGAAFINWRLLLFSLLLVPFALMIIIILGKIVKKLSKKLMETNARLVQQTIQMLNGIYIVKAFVADEHEKVRYNTLANSIYSHKMRIAYYTSLARCNNELLGICVISIAMLVGSYLTIEHKTHILGVQLAAQTPMFSSMTTFYAFLIGTADPLRKLGDIFGSVQAGIAGSERVFSILNMTPSIYDAPDSLDLPTLNKEIKFNNVNFSYHDNQPVLKNINLHIPFGQTVGIVGPNGSGKSTLIHLLLRFYDPDVGNITVGDKNLRNIKLESLRKRIGLVTQNTVLFNDSIRENIRYGTFTASEQDIQNAAQLAYADSFIKNKLNGYDTEYQTHNTQLSGGEIQRLAIARAIIKNPDVFVLDEATSQIDMESERLIVQSLRNIVKNRTAFLITHRPAVLELADIIIVMNNGTIEMIGTHSELLQKSSIYQLLYSKQFVNLLNDRCLV